MRPGLAGLQGSRELLCYPHNKPSQLFPWGLLSTGVSLVCAVTHRNCTAPLALAHPSSFRGSLGFRAYFSLYPKVKKALDQKKTTPKIIRLRTISSD